MSHEDVIKRRSLSNIVATSPEAWHWSDCGLFLVGEVFFRMETFRKFHFSQEKHGQVRD